VAFPPDFVFNDDCDLLCFSGVKKM
jgi:hypothetical protein